jgi:molybdopterin molybdotransferase
MAAIGYKALKGKDILMPTVDKAREIILSHMKTLPHEMVPLENALGRYLSRNISSSLDIPSADNSAMDGYAVRCEDIASPDTILSVSSVLPAGNVMERPLKKGEAVKIMTGAPIPAGADAVVKREDTAESKGWVTIHVVPSRREHIRSRGEDIKEGDTVLHAGDLIGPAQIGVLASLRCLVVPVHQRPLVAVLATGDEIVDLDEALSPGKITSSNSYALINLVKSSGAIPLYLGIARDTKEDLKSKLAGAGKADLLLTTGGVSMGDYDMVREIMKEEGNSLVFWKVEMKPGRPLAFGMLNGIPAIGLPGNPVSTMTSFYQFARPAILRMMGAQNILLPRVRAKLSVALDHKGDRPYFMRGVLEQGGKDLSVRPTGPQGSGILTSMARGNCYIVLPPGTRHYELGEMVDCEVYQEFGFMHSLGG